MKKRTYSVELAKLYLKRLDTLHEEIHIVREKQSWLQSINLLKYYLC